MKFIELWQQTLDRQVVFRYTSKPEWIYILAAQVDSRNINNRPGVSARAVLTVMEGSLATVAIPLSLEGMEELKEVCGLEDWLEEEVEELHGISLCMGFTGLPSESEEAELINKSVALAKGRTK